MGPNAAASPVGRVCDVTRQPGDVEDVAVAVGDRTWNLDLGPGGRKLVEEAIDAAIRSLTDDDPDRGDLAPVVLDPVAAVAAPAERVRRPRKAAATKKAAKKAAAAPADERDALRTSFTADERDACRVYGQRHFRALDLPRSPGRSGQISRQLAAAWDDAGRPDLRQT